MRFPEGLEPLPLAAVATPGASAAAAPSTERGLRSRDSAGLATSPGYWTTRRWVGVGIVAAGAVALGASAAFGVSASSAANKITQLSGTLGPTGCVGPAPGSSCAELRAAHDSQTRDHRASVALLGLGGLAAASGVVVMLLPEQRRIRMPGFAVTPWAQWGSAGADVQGKF